MFVGKVYARVAYPKVYLDVKGGLCKYIWLISKGVLSIYGYMDISKSRQILSEGVPQVSRVVFDMDVWQGDLILGWPIHIQELADLIRGCASGGLGCPRRQWASRGGKPRRAI